MKRLLIIIDTRLANELLQWAEDEMASWPSDTAYQDDLADLVKQIRSGLLIETKADHQTN